MGERGENGRTCGEPSDGGGTVQRALAPVFICLRQQCTDIQGLPAVQQHAYGVHTSGDDVDDVTGAEAQFVALLRSVVVQCLTGHKKTHAYTQRARARVCVIRRSS